MKTTSSKTYLVIGLGGLFVPLLLFSVKLLFKGYLLNTYYHTDQQILAIFDRKDASKVLPAGCRKDDSRILISSLV